MATKQAYTLYSPQLPRGKNSLIAASELTAKVHSFLELYSPKELIDIDVLLNFARRQGVIALRRLIKNRYGVDLDDSDASELGWHRIFQRIREYYDEHDADSDKDLNRIFTFTKKRGILALDNKLKKKYGISFTAFTNRRLISWKENWSSFLREHHNRTVSYELLRFYNFIQSRGEEVPSMDTFQKRVDWVCNRTRLRVNEKLLSKYNFCLDDVKMIKGNTNRERVTNLKLQLIDFYQLHDPDKVEEYNKQSEEDDKSNVVTELDKEAEWGYIHLEQLEWRLKKKYGHGLEDPETSELRRRVIDFYNRMQVRKEKETIQDIINFAQKRGLNSLNEHLMLLYGEGISTVGL